MLKVNLPPELKKEHDSIEEIYQKMLKKYRPNIDAFIPEDKEFTKRVIIFIIAVMDYVLKNYNNTDIKAYQDFLGYYDLHFCYGPNGDDMNYFDSDDNSLNGQPMKEFCWELMDDEFNMSKEKLKEIKAKYVNVLSRL